METVYQVDLVSGMQENGFLKIEVIETQVSVIWKLICDAYHREIQVILNPSNL